MRAGQAFPDCARMLCAPADIQAAEGAVLLPWISDSFELDPESGVAHVILGPINCAWVFIMYLWHQRCRTASAISCNATQKRLSCSGTVVVLSMLACLFFHGTLGFKIFSTYHEGLAHRISAVCFILTSLFIAIMVTVIEFRGDIVSFPITAVRGILCFLMLGSLSMGVVAYLLWDCPVSQITNLSGPISSSTQYNGTVCLEGAVLADVCLQRVLQPDTMCAVAPACEMSAIFWYESVM